MTIVNALALMSMLLLVNTQVETHENTSVDSLVNTHVYTLVNTLVNTQREPPSPSPEPPYHPKGGLIGMYIV